MLCANLQLCVCVCASGQSSAHNWPRQIARGTLITHTKLSPHTRTHISTRATPGSVDVRIKGAGAPLACLRVHAYLRPNQLGPINYLVATIDLSSSSLLSSFQISATVAAAAQSSPLRLMKQSQLLAHTHKHRACFVFFLFSVVVVVVDDQSIDRQLAGAFCIAINVGGT